MTQIRQLTPQIGDPSQREIYIDGSTRFAQGLASCVACLDSTVRDVVQYWTNLILLSLLVVVPMEAKTRIRDAMVQAIGMSKHLRGEAHLSVAMWIAENEPKWLKEDGSNVLSNNNNNRGGRDGVIPTSARMVQSKI